MVFPHLFVVGVGRSGTSLVQSMLAAHPKVTFLPETAFVRRYVAGRVLQKAYSCGGRDAVIAILEKDTLIKRLQISVSEAVDIIEDPSAGCLDVLVYQALISLFARTCESHLVGDKDPRLAEYVPLLNHCFPKARLIHVMRDPRDVLRSKKKAAWSRGRSPVAHVFANKVQFSMIRRSAPRLFGNRYYEIVYEELLSNPAAVLSDVCAWLDIEFDSQMLDFRDAAQHLVTQEEMAWKKETLGPLLKGNTGKWREGLTNWEAALAESACREAMQAVGASPSDSEGLLCGMHRVSMWCVAAFLAVTSPLYQTYRGAQMIWRLRH